MTTTPRTDAKLTGVVFVPASFARELETELATLRARVAELERDKARLDWLDETQFSVIKYWPTSDESYWEVGGESKATIRAAIDAAKGTP